MNKIYYHEISFIRGIACLLVVLTHITLGYDNTHYTLANQLNLTINQLARVGTPIFALISGFLLFNSTKTKEIMIKPFYISRFNKIYIPYLFWTAIYLVVGQATHTHPFNSHKILQYLFLGEGYVHLYFIIIVLQFYIIFPFIARVINQKNIIKYTLFSLIIMILWYFVRSDNPFKVIYFRAILLSWIGYFFMGGVLAYYTEEIRRYTVKYFFTLILFVVICIMAMLIEIDLPHLFQSDRVLNIVYVPIFTLFFFLLYDKIKDTKLQHFITYVGNLSMGFYLVHLLIIGGLSTYMPSWFWQPPYSLLHYILTIIFTALFIEFLLLFPYGYKILPVAREKSGYKRH
ncbi:acyltransferase [Macrococcus equipercicus]|uniref:Probable poly-beta-1,6-N-acetyl-D-glucosamine export protein n=1 Tax=Macrococcus equipercicus TaxID=69967 RepID=A0ABQ6R868_9STAP|nr:acyltransferase [Macrococcus equipercicus]KAA1039311.1 acyltransferase [Macrococcus equipercicus]